MGAEDLETENERLIRLSTRLKGFDGETISGTPKSGERTGKAWWIPLVKAVALTLSGLAAFFAALFVFYFLRALIPLLKLAPA